MSEENKQIGSVLKHLSVQTRGMSDEFDDKINRMISKNMAKLESKFDQMSFFKIPNTTSGNKEKNKIESLQDIFASNRQDAPNIAEDLYSVYNYSKKYYSTLKDYETMPSMIPTLVRVMNFLINEVISPDNQNEESFIIKADKELISEIAKIRKEHKMDKELRTIVGNRFRLGKVAYLIQGYNTLFNLVSNMKSQGIINENVQSLQTFNATLDSYSKVHSLNESFTIFEETYTENDKVLKNKVDINALNISVQYGAISEDYKHQLSTITNILNEGHGFSLNSMLNRNGDSNSITIDDMIIYESVVSSFRNDDELALSHIIKSEETVLNESFDLHSTTKDKLIKIATTLSKNKTLRRANVVSLDPARMFPLKASNRIIGYFYYDEDVVSGNNFQELLVKNLKNAKIGKDAYKETEEKVTKKTAEFLIKSIQDNLKIDNINDIDLLHDYIANSKLLNGNRKYKFYYKDDVIDISRADGSILVNSVYQAKLLAYLMHNNVVTKVVKGRDREIYTINLGGSASAAPYLYGAMDTLAGSNDGIYKALAGPMSKLFNPQIDSTIVIPTQDGAEKFISADVIQGQSVDMDLDIIKFLQNNVITSFGVDPAVVDLINNNIDFAKSLTMINKEMLIMCINEHMDLDGFKRYVLAILYEEGSDELREAIDAGKIEVSLFKPKSLLLDLAQNELSSAKSFAEALVELSPVITAISSDENDDGLTKTLAIYEIVKDYISGNIDKYDDIFDKVATDIYNKTMLNINEILKTRATKVDNKDSDDNVNNLDGEDIE